MEKIESRMTSLLPRPLSLGVLLGICLLLAFTSPATAIPRDVRVGVYANEPKIFLTPTGQLSGILGDLLNEIARQEEWRLTPVPCAWQTCLQLLQSGEIDLLPDVARNPARARSLDFHQVPSLLSWSQLYSRNDVILDSILDLKDKRIAVLAGSIQQNYLLELTGSFRLNAQLIPVQRIEEGFELVANQQADAVVTNQRFGNFHAPYYRLHATPIIFLPAQLFYATGKDRNGDLLERIDHYLLEWQGSSESFD